MTASMESFQKAIVRRQEELHKATGILARSAREYSWSSGLRTGLTVFLGAFVGTRDTALSLFVDSKTLLTIV